jgi:hypothetical protein
MSLNTDKLNGLAAYENDVREAQAFYDANPSSMNHADLYAAKWALRRHCPTEPCVLCSGNGWRKVWFQGRLEERTCCDCHGKGVRPVRPNDKAQRTGLNQPKT